MKDSFELFADLCKEKSYHEKIEFLVSHLNRLDQAKYKLRLDNSMLYDSGFESMFISKEKILQSIVEERLNEDYAMQLIRGEPFIYCANDYYPLINYVINTDETFKNRPVNNTDFRKVSINEILDIGISVN